ncbi:MAG: T9SS type A sorting domain-containing protein [Lishizhenia sp.]
MKRSLLLIVLTLVGFTTQATTYSAYTVVNASNNQSIYVQVDDVTNQLTMILSGNASKYMAFGFGASNMAGDTYVINTNGANVQERNLGYYNTGGSPLSSTVIIESDVTNAGIRTVTLKRDIVGLNASYFDFSPAISSASIPIIWAHGANTSFGYHQSRGATTLSFTQDCYITISNTTTECSTSFVGPTGNIYTSNGVYIDTARVLDNCDIIYTTDLTLALASAAYFTVSECTSYTVPSGDETYNSSGIYTDTISNVAGCDSVLTINLTVNQATSSTETVNTCGSYISNGNTYTSSGTYTEMFTNANGCDSTRTINLTLTPIFASAVLSVDGLSASTPTQGDAYQWIICNSNLPVSGATISTFSPGSPGDFAVVVSEGTCSDTSECLTIGGAANIKEQTKNFELLIYPNPTTEYVTLKFNNPLSGKISITNILGERLTEISLYNETEKEILITGGVGVYFIEVSSNNRKITRRVIKR